MAIAVERRLGDHVGVTAAKAMLVEVNTTVAERLVAGGASSASRRTLQAILPRGSKLLPMETFAYGRGFARSGRVAPHPVREDQEVTVELEYALTYSPGDAVAHIGRLPAHRAQRPPGAGRETQGAHSPRSRGRAMGVLLA